MIDQIAEVNRGSLLVITGGEPLVRPDILDIARHAVKHQFMVVFGTNGMLIDDAMAKDRWWILGSWVLESVLIRLIQPHTMLFAECRMPGREPLAGIEACKRNGSAVSGSFQCTTHEL